MWHSSNIWEWQWQIKMWWRRKLRGYWTPIILATTRSTNLWPIVCCLREIKIRICKTIILSVVLNECETWSLTLREDRRVFQNRALKRIFRPRGDELAGIWRKLLNEKFRNNLRHSPIIIRMTKSKSMSLTGHVARIGEKKRNACRVLVRSQKERYN
jgi:hypothetical protein